MFPVFCERLNSDEELLFPAARRKKWGGKTFFLPDEKFISSRPFRPIKMQEFFFWPIKKLPAKNCTPQNSFLWQENGFPRPLSKLFSTRLHSAYSCEHSFRRISPRRKKLFHPVWKTYIPSSAHIFFPPRITALSKNMRHTTGIGRKNGFAPSSLFFHRLATFHPKTRLEKKNKLYFK